MNMKGILSKKWSKRTRILLIKYLFPREHKWIGQPVINLSSLNRFIQLISFFAKRFTVNW